MTTSPSLQAMGRCVKPILIMVPPESSFAKPKELMKVMFVAAAFRA